MQTGQAKEGCGDFKAIVRPQIIGKLAFSMVHVLVGNIWELSARRTSVCRRFVLHCWQQFSRQLLAMGYKPLHSILQDAAQKHSVGIEGDRYCSAPQNDKFYAGYFLLDRVEDAKSCNSCGLGIVSCPSFSSFGFRWHSTRHSPTTTRQWSFLNILMIDKHCLSAQTRKGDYRTADGRVKVISITKVIVSGMTLAWRLVSEMQSSPTSHFRSQIIIRRSVRSDDRWDLVTFIYWPCR